MQHLLCNKHRKKLVLTQWSHNGTLILKAHTFCLTMHIAVHLHLLHPGLLFMRVMK